VTVAGQAGHPGPALAGVVLAAGEGRRLRPLTHLRPKPLCPVGGTTTLLDRALEAVTPHSGSGPEHVAVNAHHLTDQVVAHVGESAHVSVEAPQALGTAGALGHLSSWLDGRSVLLANGDAYLAPRAGSLDPALARLVEGWDGERCRLLVAPAGHLASGSGRSLRPDFTDARGDWVYVGACVLPGEVVARLPATPSGLYEQLWRDLDARDQLDLFAFDGTAIDCGTPQSYLRANLHASGGASVVGPGAVVEGRLTRAVVWDGAWVGHDEDLVEVVRAGDRTHRLTVDAHS
jgi:NDP-sugar pyrophosphorylase family protein